MSVTNFPNGITTPFIQGAGYGGIPLGGTHFYVKPYSGSDSNSGLNPDEPLKTLTRAHALMTADKNDVCHLIAESVTGTLTSDFQSSTLTWSKNMCHLVGECTPLTWSPRARIAQASTATTVSNLMSITASGCLFRDLQIIQECADDAVKICLKVTGQRNRFERIHVAGIIDPTQVSATHSSGTSVPCDMLLDGAAELDFVDCTFGVDTTARDQNCYGIQFDSAVTRVRFNGCRFDGYVSNAGYTPIRLYDTTAIDRLIIFERPIFSFDSTNRATNLTQVFAVNAGTVQGKIMLVDPSVCEPAANAGLVWSSTGSTIIFNNSPAAALSAAGGEMTAL
jgi:hypothetical protein